MLLGSSDGDQVKRALGNEDAATPAHFDTEVYSAVRRLHRIGLLGIDQAQHMLIGLARFDGQRVPIPPLLPEAFIYRDRFSAYDVFYAVLARQKAARILTVDAAFARACQGYVEVVTF